MRLHQYPTYLRQFGICRGTRFYLADLARAVLDPYARIYYSQGGEDTILRTFEMPAKGFYVEVGANHPEHRSNVFEFYRRGWHGISIEANEAFVAKHRRARPRDVIVCAVVSNTEQQVKFTEFHNHLISSASSEFATAMKDGQGMTVATERWVQSRTLTNILESEGCPAQFDLLSIDVEGHDYEVLTSLDLGRYRPKVIIIEMHDFAFSSIPTDRICQHLQKNGYELIGHVATNSYFKDASWAS